MSVKIIIIGADEANKMLKDKENKINNEASQALKKATFFMQGEVKSSIAGQRAEPTSVDTGRSLNSVDINVGNKDAIVFSDVEYAKYLEYGTSRIKPRSHFRNSVARNKEKVREILVEDIKKII